MTYDYLHPPHAPRRVAMGYPGDDGGFVAYAHLNGEAMNARDFQYLVRLNHEILLLQGRMPEFELRIIPQRAKLFRLPEKALNGLDFVGTANDDSRPYCLNHAYNQHLLIGYTEALGAFHAAAWLNGEYLEPDLFARWMRLILASLVHLLPKAPLDVYRMSAEHEMSRPIFYFDDTGLINPKTGASVYG